ncbi:unnamed protein product, partial [Prorocentrum cordatum]
PFRLRLFRPPAASAVIFFWRLDRRGKAGMAVQVRRSILQSRLPGGVQKVAVPMVRDAHDPVRRVRDPLEIHHRQQMRTRGTGSTTPSPKPGWRSAPPSRTARWASPDGGGASCRPCSSAARWSLMPSTARTTSRPAVKGETTAAVATSWRLAEGGSERAGVLG